MSVADPWEPGKQIRQQRERSRNGVDGKSRVNIVYHQMRDPGSGRIGRVFRSGCDWKLLSRLRYKEVRCPGRSLRYFFTRCMRGVGGAGEEGIGASGSLGGLEVDIVGSQTRAGEGAG